MDAPTRTTASIPIHTHPSGNPVGKPDTPYLLNCWYVAAMSRELGAEAMLTRQLLDTSVLMYRKADGTPVAMHDRCPHRFVPLSMGERHGDDVVCKYHALRFDCSGQCTHNPHGTGRIPAAAKVRTFPLLEKYGFVWIWMGDEPADMAKLPDFSALDNGPASGVAHTYMPMKAHYELIVDNVMDLSHIDHVHGEIITTRGQLSPLIPPVKEDNNTLNARWEWRQTPAMMIFANFLPDPKAEARGFFDITWSAVCIASGVSDRPSRPPAPSRTISFSRSMTSNEKSGRTRTTIMWREFVPTSTAGSSVSTPRDRRLR